MVRDWSFLLRPRWVLSHLFAASLIAGFLWAGFWQLDRLEQRRTENAIILDRSTAEPLTVGEALRFAASEDQLDYVRIADRGEWLDGEVIRVANRSLNGLGGDWVIGLFETVEGQQVLVNRGFATRDAVALDPEPAGPITGWLRSTRVKDGFFGAVDTGEGARVPRLDVDLIEQRFGLDVAPAWLQLDDPAFVGPPEPIPLPAIDERNHFSYAMQWFISATLSIVVYGLMLRKKAGDHAKRFDIDLDDRPDPDEITSEVARAG